MKYAPPIGQEAQGEEAHYVDGNPELGILGSPVPAAAIEQGQRELLHVIKQAGLTPSSEDLTQLFRAIGKLISDKVPIASKETAGIVKPGSSLTINGDGTLDLGPVTATGTTAQRSIPDRCADITNVMDYGAAADGKTDDTAAFEQAAATGRLVFVPAGEYRLSKVVQGDFFSTGPVKTNQDIFLLDGNSFKVQRFFQTLKLRMAFTVNVPIAPDGERYYLQGFCSDGEDIVFIGLRTASHSYQKILRYTISTGAIVEAEFQDLWHVNSMTYRAGRLYITPMHASYPGIVVLDADTLARERDFTPDQAAAGGYALTFDPYTARFYYTVDGNIHIYTEDWRHSGTVPLALPSWLPSVGQAVCAYKGLLIYPRTSSADTVYPLRHESLVIYDLYQQREIHVWDLGPSYGEIESVAILRDKLLLGFNDGGQEIPFYVTEFDRAARYRGPLSTDTYLSLLTVTPFRINQEMVTLYCDSASIFAGDGSESRPFNSLRRAIWCARNTASSYRVIIYLAGDFSAHGDILLQGADRLFEIRQWQDKNRAVLPPMMLIDTDVRMSNIGIKGVSTYLEENVSLFCENSYVELRDVSFMASNTDISADSYVFSLRGDLLCRGLDFTGTSGHPPVKRYVVAHGGGTLTLLSEKATYKFPADGEDICKFEAYGMAATQYADCRDLVTSMVYQAGKGGQLFG